MGKQIVKTEETKDYIYYTDRSWWYSDFVADVNYYHSRWKWYYPGHYIAFRLKAYNIEIKGKDILIIGRSISVGKPVSIMLLNEHATVSIAHTRTLNLDEKISRADIVVAAVGRPHIIDSSKCKEGAIVIDAGIHYLEEGIVGDVIPSSKLKYISKVPGGVGILTSTLIMDNVYRCYLRRKYNGI